MSQTDVDYSLFTYKTTIAGQTFRGELFDSYSTDEWKTSILAEAQCTFPPPGVSLTHQ